MNILRYDDLPQGGFAGLLERQFVQRAGGRESENGEIMGLVGGYQLGTDSPPIEDGNGVLTAVVGEA